MKDTPLPLYVVGGSQRARAHFEREWHGYRRALIVRVEGDKGDTDVMVEYTSPPEVRPPEKPSILFKAGSIRNRTLHVCTQTEVIGYSLPGFEQTSYLTLPFFNDLHHVVRTDQETYMVAATGLDLVVEVDNDGQTINEWNVLGEDPWHRFSRSVDYRLIPTTKPHKSHPNYLFWVDDALWVTRFEQRDAVNLLNQEERIPIGNEAPHDGVVHNGSIYFTTVDGHVVVADAASKEVRLDVDLNELTRVDRHLGWCRGLLVAEPDVVVVGFSRLRPSTVRKNLRWVKHRVGKRTDAGNLPTRIACYDLRRRKLLWEHNLEEAGMNAVFSIHAAG